jgi:hypothetical protein
MTTLSYDEEYERIAELHKLPLFVVNSDPDYLLKSLIPGLLWACLYMASLYLLCLMIGNILFPQEIQDTALGAHKVTHFLGNVSIAALGLYYYNYSLPINPDVEEMVSGCKHIYPLACLQIAKQLWALVQSSMNGGIKERTINYVHHVAVAIVSMSFLCFTLGIRYWVPFLLGVTEISSIFLAAVEAMRDYPLRGSKRYPGLYKTIQLCFAVSFLYIRVYLFLPQAWVFMRLGLWCLLSSERLEVFGWIFWIAGLFLVVLQAWWGVLIVKKTIRDHIIKPNAKKAAKHNSNSNSNSNEGHTNKSKSN